MRFIADVMLGRLARWLRFLGYDTRYGVEADGDLLRIARAERRVLLTRDTALWRRCRRTPRLSSALFIRSDRVAEQLAQVVQDLGIPVPALGPRRCLACNGVLAPIPSEEAMPHVPAFIGAQHATFVRCDGCGRIYWPGSHLRRMEETVARLCG